MATSVDFGSVASGIGGAILGAVGSFALFRARLEVLSDRQARGEATTGERRREDLALIETRRREDLQAIEERRREDAQRLAVSLAALQGSYGARCDDLKADYEKLEKTLTTHAATSDRRQQFMLELVAQIAGKHGITHRSTDLLTRTLNEEDTQR